MYGLTTISPDRARAAGARSRLARRETTAAMLAATALTLLVRVAFFSWPLTVDEGAYAYTAHWWFRGLTLYSTDLWFDRPQAIFVAYQAGIRLLGESTAAIRLWGALWAAATACGAYLVALRLWDRRSAWTALVLVAVFTAAPNIEGFTANAELFMVLPAVFSAYCLLTRRWAWAGALASMALLLKPSGVVAVLFGVAWMLTSKARWQDWLWFSIAAAVLPILSALNAALTVGLGPYLDAIVWYRLSVYASSGYRPDGPAIDGWMRTFSVWGPLTVPAAVAMWRLRGERLLFVTLWIATSIIGIAMGGRWLMHYFLQLIVPLATVAGAGLVVLTRDARPAVRWAAIPVLAGGLALFARSDVSYAFMPPARGIDRLYSRPGYLIADDVGRYLRTRAAPDDTLYVAFYEADIYHLAGMRSASPYLFRLDVEHRLAGFDDLVRNIETSKPAYVLDMRQPLDPRLDRGRFERALRASYIPERIFPSAILYRRAAPQ